MPKRAREEHRKPRPGALRAAADELGITTPATAHPRRRKRPLRVKVLKDGRRTYYRR